MIEKKNTRNTRIQERSVGAKDLALADGGSLEKIREILFGTQSRIYDDRLAELASEIERHAAALRDDVSRRLDVLTEKVEGFESDLRGELENEIARRTEALGELRANLEERLVNLEEIVQQQTTRNHLELQEQLKEARTELEDRVDGLDEELRSKTRDLDRKGLSRIVAARLLREVADGIQGDDSSEVS